MKTQKQMMLEIKDILDRFMIRPSQLKDSPYYEKDLVLDRAYDELEYDTFCLLIDLMYPEKEIKKEKVKKNVLCVETGEIKTVASWSTYFYGNRIFYINFSKGLSEFKYRDKTYKKVGDWE